MEKLRYENEIEKKRQRKNRRKFKQKRLAAIVFAIIAVVFLTEQFPSGMLEKDIADVNENQVVLASIQQIMTKDVRESILTVVNRQGKWKCISTESEEFDEIVGDRWDGIMLHLTADIADDVFASELVPFQEGKIRISKRSLEWAINQGGSVNEDYDFKWERKIDIRKDMACQSSYYTVGGPKNRCVHKVGYFGFVENRGRITPATLRLYPKFMEIDLRVRRAAGL